MLRYKIPVNDAITDNISIPVEDYKTIFLDRDYFHKVKRYFITESNSSIVKGGTVNALHRILVHNDLARNAKVEGGKVVYYDTIEGYDEYVAARVENDELTATDSYSKYEFTESLPVLDVTDDDDKIANIFGSTSTNVMMFSTLSDRFFKLKINKVSTYLSTTYFSFEYAHLFNPSNEKVNLWLHFNDNGEDVNVNVECEYVNITTLKTSNLKIIECLDNSGSKIEDKGEILKTLLNDADLYKTIVYMRETPFFCSKDDRTTTDAFRIYTFNPKKGITIGLSRSDGINMMQSDYVNSFIETTKKESINKITEMEKDVYHPVILKTIYNGEIPSDTKYEILDDVYTIKFNLHFREHRGEDWLVNPDSYWNGTVKKGENVTLIGDVEGAKFFNAYDNVKVEGKYTKKLNPDKQSDLLSYLNFKDDDVKYRKNKLKKSFLRLSFYDSTNPANQNLLAYSTIFVDTGDLYGRYLKYGGFTSSNNVYDDGDYTSITYKANGDKYVMSGRTNLKGVKVNRDFEYVTEDNPEYPSEYRIYKSGNEYKKGVKEYDSDKIKLVPFDGVDNIDPEERRLSSQFVVKGRDTSESSSEGFYLYLWKDNDGGIVPSDIYMKVEFNHAGYGRTIPFMMPYWDRKTTKKCGIKSFQDILDDWNNASKDEYDPPRDTRYTVQDYIKYSYIKLKYRYDKENERHIYYLDDTVYSNQQGNDNKDCDNNVYFSDNTITFNLYEAKII